MKLSKTFVLMFFAAAFFLVLAQQNIVQSQSGATEAPTGFDNKTNGLVTQTIM